MFWMFCAASVQEAICMSHGWFTRDLLLLYFYTCIKIHLHTTRVDSAENIYPRCCCCCCCNPRTMVRLRFAGLAGRAFRSLAFLVGDWLYHLRLPIPASARLQTSCCSVMIESNNIAKLFRLGFTSLPAGRWCLGDMEAATAVEEATSENDWVINSGTLGICTRSPISISISSWAGNLIEQKAVYISQPSNQQRSRTKWVNVFT